VITAVTEPGATGDYDSKELELQVEVTIAGRPTYTAVVRQLVGGDVEVRGGQVDRGRCRP
jgi:hypothetical protein